MKNKIMYTCNLVMVYLFTLAIPVIAQPSMSKKDSSHTRRYTKLEQRNQRNERIHPGLQVPDNKMEDDHFGGKQNFRIEHGAPNDYGFSRFRHPGHHQRYGNRPFSYRGGYFGHRNRYRELRRAQNWRMHRDGIRRAYSDGFKHGQRNEKTNQELKTLRTQIWKDGVMDLKERDLIREKMKSRIRN